jgi:hypothetical protein
LCDPHNPKIHFGEIGIGEKIFYHCRKSAHTTVYILKLLKAKKHAGFKQKAFKLSKT